MTVLITRKFFAIIEVMMMIVFLLMTEMSLDSHPCSMRGAVDVVGAVLFVLPGFFKCFFYETSTNRREHLTLSADYIE